MVGVVVVTVGAMVGALVIVVGALIATVGAVVVVVGAVVVTVGALVLTVGEAEVGAQVQVSSAMATSKNIAAIKRRRRKPLFDRD
jgi:hypothetical protein